MLTNKPATKTAHTSLSAQRRSLIFDFVLWIDTSYCRDKHEMNETQGIKCFVTSRLTAVNSLKCRSLGYSVTDPFQIRRVSLINRQTDHLCHLIRMIRPAEQM